MSDGPTIRVETAHGDPVTVGSVDDLQNDEEIRRQVGETVRAAAGDGAKERTSVGPAIAGNARLAPPDEESFDDLGVEFIESEAIKHLAERLIDRHERFSHLKRFTVFYGWKKEGGKRDGRARLGQCVKPGWLAHQYSEADFVIALSADHLRLLDYSEREIEGVLYHEMLHAGFNKYGEPKLIPHEFEDFFSELEHYGDVLPTWELVGDRLLQTRLPGV